MFIKIFEKETETYNVGEGFQIDIVNSLGYTEIWLYHKDYGIKDLMFGLTERDYKKLLEIIENNLPEAKTNYILDHMEIETEIK